MILGSFAVPSLTPYRELCALCAGASLLAAIVVLLVPRHGHDHVPDEAVAPAERVG